ncbi:ADP-ribosyltransferase [Streptosporangium sp. NPDC050855]|uniref:ADP-ribosyltransferase n=1 Tax=Streptosporangium sp. NPDC050855 TaxID=3366194 RepID=UPI00378FF3B7
MKRTAQAVASPKPSAAKAPAAKPAAKTPPSAGTTKAAPRDKKFLDDHYGSWRNSLSPAQDKAMRFYQSPGFALMNGQLRGLNSKDIKADVSFNDADLDRARKASKDLNSAIKKAPPLTEPMTVYRGFSADQFGELKPGQELSDKGFVSTSLTNDVGSVGRATRQATAEITLPKGTKAAAGSNREMVLPPGSKFRVVSVTTRKGVPHVHMELML